MTRYIQINPRTKTYTEIAHPTEDTSCFIDLATHYALLAAGQSTVNDSLDAERQIKNLKGYLHERGEIIEKQDLEIKTLQNALASTNYIASCVIAIGIAASKK